MRAAWENNKISARPSFTFAPLDRALIDVSMLIAAERAWIDAYHADVARIIGPQLDGAAQAWLMNATRPLN